MRVTSAPRRSRLAALVVLSLAPAVGAAQGARPPARAAAATSPITTAPPPDSGFFASMKWREIGPMRGGRSVAAAGSAARPFEYWWGTTGGGVFKTTDGGITWVPMTDKYFGGPVGAIGVAESNPDVVYVGTGEYPIRGNVSIGEGVWKTTDGGKTWSFLGLKETRQISRVKVHPTNPDIVYVGAQGNFAVPTADRGVYKTTDGGKTWRKVLFRSDSAGVTDLVMDPTNPNILYAALWQSYRTPWMMSSGGTRGGMYKSTDAGETWTELTQNTGLPRGMWGNVGLTVSGANPNRLWALIEADSGGVFRSDDAGRTWTKVNEQRSLRQRAWYYSKIFADPKDANTVYALNVGFFRSTDGGRTWRTIAVPHGDNHDLWIAPNDPKRMIQANDGGANVSFNAGASWSEQDVATAQFYHVTTTTDFPYKVCGAQQDNSTVCIASRANGGINFPDWYDVGGGESGYIAVRPDKTNVVFAGSYGGELTRCDTDTDICQNVNPWPDNPMGYSSKDIKYRFQWTYPIIISPHNPNKLYATANHVFVSMDEGQSFKIISPDLTRHDPKTMEASGGPITKDQTGVETYATIFTLAESPVTPGVIWTGSDDGYVFLTRDNGATWNNVTPRELGDFTRISIIEASPHNAGTAYLAGNRFALGEYQPILFKTADYGKTWTRIDAGIAREEFTRVIREDPVRRGLLYAGTERSVWVSFDDGANWRPLKMNLPPVPIHDLEIRRDGDLVAATHGRAFWILDDVSPLRQHSAQVASAAAHLYKPRDAYHVSFGGGGGGGDRGAHPVGQNPPDGVVVYYKLASAGQEVTLDFLDAAGKSIRSFTSRMDSLGMADSVRADSVRRARTDSLRRVGAAVPQSDTAVMAREEQPAPDFEELARRGPRAPRAPNKAGLNTFVWDTRYPDAVRFRNLIMWAGNTTGPKVPPGTYSVRLTVAGQPAQTQTFRILRDPRNPATQADLEAQVALLLRIRDRTSDANNGVRTIRNVKSQLDDRMQRASGNAAIAEAARTLRANLSAVEEEIYQVRNQSNQDPLNYPIKLNNKIAALAGVVSSADGRPPAQMYTVFNDLSGKLDVQLTRMRTLLAADLARLNALLRAAGLPEIVPKTDEVPDRPQIAADDDDTETHR